MEMEPMWLSIVCLRYLQRGYRLHLEKWMRQSSLWGLHQNLICRVFSLCHMKWTTQKDYILKNLSVILKGSLLEETVRWKLGNLRKIPNQNAITQIVVGDGLQISTGQRWIWVADE
uniref:Uncharacterized protein n=1 Tax=Rhizophora mucronata TaxID=61149 RepID=A0A2P2JTE7_RHIMU